MTKVLDANSSTLLQALGTKSKEFASEVTKATLTGLKLPESDPWVILCGFEKEKAVTVDWQVRELKVELASAPVRGVTELRDPAAWAALTALQTVTDGGLSLKANVQPSAPSPGSRRRLLHPSAVVHAHAGNGIVFVHLPEADGTLKRAAGIVSQLAKLATAGNANLIVTVCPPAWKASLPVWGRDPGDRRE